MPKTLLVMLWEIFGTRDHGRFRILVAELTFWLYKLTQLFFYHHQEDIISIGLDILHRFHQKKHRVYRQARFTSGKMNTVRMILLSLVTPSPSADDDVRVQVRSFWYEREILQTIRAVWNWY